MTERMTDLEIAKSELYDEKLTLAIIKDCSVIYVAKNPPVNGFLEAIKNCGNQLEGASLACHAAGKAVALLCVYAKVKEVYAAVLSRKAQAVFKVHKIGSHWNSLVEKVPDVDNTGMARFEGAVAEVSDPAKAYQVLKTLQGSIVTSKQQPANSLYRSRRDI
jgi:hypothetical protein